MATRRSRVHTKQRTESRVANWPDDDRALVSRGDITLWLSPAATKAWKAKPTGRRGAQPKDSDLAIETVLTIRLVFGLPLRQAEGFVCGLFMLMDDHLDVPDHTTLARRARSLTVAVPIERPLGPAHLASVTADAAYDTRHFYRAVGKRRVDVVVPPHKNATTGRGSCNVRERTVHRVFEVGRG